jgi:hypothetical protein
MCYVLRYIRHRSGATECAELFYSDATEFLVAVTVWIFTLLGGFHMSRRIRMDSQGSFICQGTPTPKFYLHQRPHAMGWKQFINDFQQIPEN